MFFTWFSSKNFAISSGSSLTPCNSILRSATISWPPRPQTTPFAGLLTNLFGEGSSPSYASYFNTSDLTFSFMAFTVEDRGTNYYKISYYYLAWIFELVYSDEIGYADSNVVTDVGVFILRAKLKLILLIRFENVSICCLIFYIIKINIKHESGSKVGESKIKNQNLYL